jgi:hypothetical protein
MIGIIGTGFPSTTDFLNLLVLAVFARTAKKNDKLTNQDIGILIQKILDKDVYDECNLDVHSQDVTNVSIFISLNAYAHPNLFTKKQ